MSRYLVKRLGHAVFVVLGVSTVVFFILRLSGDPVLLMLPVDATQADVIRLRHALGFDRPLYVQYVRFMASIFQGDAGESIRYGQPALRLVLERLPATLQLASAALIFALGVAFPIGILSATRRGSLIDNIGSVVALLGQATPVFWLGIMFILEFSVRLKWLPASGYGTIGHLVLPSITLGLYLAAVTTRMLRSSMLEVLGQDYVRTAKAKGLSNSAVVVKHTLKNALLPVITVIGLQFAALLGGSVVTETVFAWPGVGRLVIQAIYNRDYPLVQASVLVISAVFVIANLVVDLIYGYIDPRIRYE
ncbi:MAG: ABC transporter permease [Firmicutes bacterium]|nr:ABC transporter permease [Bacillota bacterium]